MNIAQLFEKQDSTGLTPDQYKAQELARKQAGAAKYTATKNQPGTNAFGGMASQLTGAPKTVTSAPVSTPSSTGGTTTPTPTGQIHQAANATNPNQATTTPATAPAGDKGAVTGLANTVAGATGGVSKAVGAVGGGIAGACGVPNSLLPHFGD
jgi:hypothetical protein